MPDTITPIHTTRHADHRVADVLARLRDPCQLEVQVPGITSVLAVLRTILEGHARPQPGFWHTPLTKTAVFAHVAVTHPAGLGITHKALWDLGLRSAANAMLGQDFDVAAERLGVPRLLAQRRHGTWTRDYALDRYADLVRAAGTAVTSRMLVDRGGDARLVYVAAHRSPGGWPAFLVEAARRHPDLPMPGAATASDGTRHDSQQEVVAYEAIRRTLPQAMIETQVRLPRKTGRPWIADLLVGGTVYVEVTGVESDDEGTDPYRVAYRRRLARKLVHYRDALDTTPVLIGPRDVADPRRLQERIAEIAARLGLDPVPPASPGPARHVLGTWQDNALCERELRRLAEVHGRWPTIGEITAAGMCGLSTWVRAHGGPRAVAGRLRLRYVRQPAAGQRRDARRRGAMDRLMAYARVTGRLPGSDRHRGRGHTLGRAVIRLGGAGRAARLISEHLGEPIAASRHPAGYWNDPAAVKDVARILVERLGRMPLVSELVAEAGSTTIAAAVARQGGIHALRERLGTTAATARRPPGHWRRRDVLVALARDVASRMDGPVTLDALCAHAGTKTVGHGVRAVGGLPVVLGWLAGTEAVPPRPDAPG